MKILLDLTLRLSKASPRGLGGKTCKVLELLNLLLVSPEYLEGLIFSAMMPKEKIKVVSHINLKRTL